jgi:hypothetical protein
MTLFTVSRYNIGANTYLSSHLRHRVIRNTVYTPEMLNLLAYTCSSPSTTALISYSTQSDSEGSTQSQSRWRTPTSAPTASWPSSRFMAQVFRTHLAITRRHRWALDRRTSEYLARLLLSACCSSSTDHYTLRDQENAKAGIFRGLSSYRHRATGSFIDDPPCLSIP